MIEFLTLFLGAIVTGPTEVRLMVSGDVAAIEILLDEDSLTVLRASPWQVEVDFSEELEPHVLEAIAYGNNGQELDRTRQWINLAPDTADIRIVLERDSANNAVSARLSWRSITHNGEPLRVRAYFDGKPLDVIDLRQIPLPPHDPKTMHHLRVELQFPDELESATEVTFGGAFGEAVDTALTAFPVALIKGRRLPSIEAMQGWFLSDGLPLQVHSKEKGLVEILFIRDPEIQPVLEKMLSLTRRDTGVQLLNSEHRLRFLHARHHEQESRETGFELFRLSPPLRLGSGLLRALAAVYLADMSDQPARIADAVAVAGLAAHKTGRRRAVVLITGGPTNDPSLLSPQQVRRYLGRIGVPLFVWNPVRGATEAGSWGPAINIFLPVERLESAYREMSRRLNRQRVIWFNGLHLPQTIQMDPAVEGVELVR
jgi:hypothetical protein